MPFYFIFGQKPVFLVFRFFYRQCLGPTGRKVSFCFLAKGQKVSRGAHFFEKSGHLFWPLFLKLVCTALHFWILGPKFRMNRRRGSVARCTNLVCTVAYFGQKPRISEGNLYLVFFGQKVGGHSVMVQKGQHWRPKFVLLSAFLAPSGPKLAQKP